MAYTLRRIYNQGELRTIGIGWRLVEVAVGRKWVRVRHPAKRSVCRVTRAEWHRISGDPPPQRRAG